ncbi:MAG: metal-sulfur cluster assembly factor [Candidatus Micrarchaeota archaeon]
MGENLVDLGLIYGVDVKGGAVKVRMTLTTPGCPMHAFLTKQAEEAVKKVKGVKKAEVELVWDPPWTPDKMSEATQKRLGWSK